MDNEWMIFSSIAVSKYRYSHTQSGYIWIARSIVAAHLSRHCSPGQRINAILGRGSIVNSGYICIYIYIYMYVM